MPNLSPSSTGSLTTAACAWRSEPSGVKAWRYRFTLRARPACSPWASTRRQPGRGARPVRSSAPTRQTRHQPRPAAADRPHQASQRRRDHLREGGARMAANQRLGRRHQEPAPGHAGTRGVWRDRQMPIRCHHPPTCWASCSTRSSAAPLLWLLKPAEPCQPCSSSAVATLRADRPRLAVRKALPANKTQHKTALTTLRRSANCSTTSTTTAAPDQLLHAADVVDLARQRSRRSRMDRDRLGPRPVAHSAERMKARKRARGASAEAGRGMLRASKPPPDSASTSSPAATTETPRCPLHHSGRL